MSANEQKKFTFTLLGEVRSKKNSRRNIVRGGRKYSVPSEAHESWHEEASLQLYKMKCPKFKGQVAIEITFVTGTKAKADLTNKAESIMDLLVDHEIIKDDNVFVLGKVTLIFGGVEPKNPHTRIMIEGV